MEWEASYGRYTGTMVANANDEVEIGFSTLLTEEISPYTDRLMQLKSTAKKYHGKYIA